MADSTPAQYTNATDDLCYRDQNALLHWNGTTTELVLDDATGVWRLADNDGSRIELLTGSGGTQNYNNERWRLTTADGTQFWFGRTQLPGWTTGNPITNAVWGVPVFANRSSEPCFQTGGFAGSWCSMAWRWNLDYVVDPHGNSMSYWYRKEVSSTKLAGTTAVRGYDRAGVLERIDYGTREGTELASDPLNRVLFSSDPRCLGNCGTDAAPTAANFPDTPWDLQCSAAPCANNPAPSFWTSKRLRVVTTLRLVNGAYSSTDNWTLDHSFPATGETDPPTDPSLWLTKITRTGVGSLALPSVFFVGTRYANRTDYDLSAAVPQVRKYRITGITSETGGQTLVTYQASDCTATSQADPAQNGKRCFPQYYTPPDAAPGWSWWNKYRVSTVTERDLVGGSPDVVESYGYDTVGSSSTVLWHHNDIDKYAQPLPKRSWSDWRGFAIVTVISGVLDSGDTSRSTYRYFRGLNADRTDAGETARTVSITDSHGTSWVDHNALTGFLLEQIDYDAAGNPVEKTRHTPWRPAAPSAVRVEHPDHLQPTRTEAWYTDVLRDEAFDYLAASSTWRESEAEYAYDDTYGQLTSTTDRGDVATTSDDVCTTVSYARTTTGDDWLTDYPAETITTNCATTPGPDDVLTGSRSYYDSSTTLGAPPTRGLETLSTTLDSYTGSTANWVSTEATTYDQHGRVRLQTDALNRTTETSYTPEVGGLLTAVTVKNPAAQTTTWTLNGRGDVTTETDPAGKVTTLGYDGLGRLTGVWLPGLPTNQTPNSQYLYAVRGETGTSYVETRELGPNGNTIVSFDIYDGLDRVRQEQTTAPDGKRVIADTRYDARDLTVTESELYNNASGPTSTLLTFTDSAVPSQTRTTYDALDRPLTEDLWSQGVKKWGTSYTYDGDRINIMPPAGDTPITAVSDVSGRTTALLQYKGATPAGDHDRTTYGYDRLDQLTGIQDPAGNQWAFGYDRRGRLTTQTDPDTGTTHLGYDNADQLTTTTDGRGEKLFTAYDNLGRATELRDDSATGALRASWTWDTLRKGYLTSATRYSSGQQYVTAVAGYTDLGDPTGISITIPAVSAYGTIAGTYATGYTYKPDGSLASTTHPAAGDLPAETVTNTYTNAGDLTAMIGADTYLAEAQYHWTGDIKQQLLGTGNKRARLATGIDEATGRHTKTQLHTEHPGAPNTWDEQLTELYQHDPAGNVQAINEINETSGTVVSQQCLQYDRLRRLTEAWTTTATQCQNTPTTAAIGGPAPYWQSFTYDTVGNRITDTIHNPDGTPATRDYTTTPAAGAAQPHTLTRRATRGGAAATDYTYDAGGNLATRTGTGVNETYTFDAEGSLTTLATTGSHTYLYDDTEQRLIADDPTAVTAYLGNTELRRDKTTGQVTATRYYPNAVRTATGLTFTAGDYDGTVHTAIDATTLTTTRRRTNPFGETRGTPPTTWPDRKGFVGGTNDASGYTHLGARQYDPTTGRFIAPDPILTPDDPQQLHPYTYAANNPITYNDPDGLQRKLPMEGGGWGGPMSGGGARGGSSRGGESGGGGRSRASKPKKRTSTAGVSAAGARIAKAARITAQKARAQAKAAHTHSAKRTTRPTAKKTTPAKKTTSAKGKTPAKKGQTPARKSTPAKAAKPKQPKPASQTNANPAKVKGPSKKGNKPRTTSDDVARQTLGPSHSSEGVTAARGDEVNKIEQVLVNIAGDKYGCHSCGARVPGYKDGHWTGDHIPPHRAAPNGPWTLHPQCQICMRQQGGIVNGLNQGWYDF